MSDTPPREWRFYIDDMIACSVFEVHKGGLGEAVTGRIAMGTFASLCRSAQAQCGAMRCAYCDAPNPRPRRSGAKAWTSG